MLRLDFMNPGQLLSTLVLGFLVCHKGLLVTCLVERLTEQHKGPAASWQLCTWIHLTLRALRAWDENPGGPASSPLLRWVPSTPMLWGPGHWTVGTVPSELAPWCGLRRRQDRQGHRNRARCLACRD
uniref:Uncharacterized protein n=1 Tax=Sus scrofa TaxID=9823 RepID=A0A8D0YPY5_PIG